MEARAAAVWAALQRAVVASLLLGVGLVLPPMAAASPVYLRPGTPEPGYGDLLGHDVNADGAVDLMATGDPADPHAHGSIYLNDGDGSFRAAGAYAGGRFDAQIADVNGDGIGDLVARSEANPPQFGKWDATPITVSLGRSSGFGDPSATPAPERVDQLVVGDFNGDGHIDAVENSFISRRVWLFRGDGSGGLGSPQPIAFGGDYEPIYETAHSGLAAGDVNADGRTDLLLTGAPCQLMLGNADSGLGPAQTVATACSAAKLADVDGDGRLDIVSTAVLRGDGGGHFMRIAAVPSERAPTLIADVTGDRRPDLLATGNTTIAVATSLGRGQFTPYHEYWAVPPHIGIGEGGFFATPEVVADFNDDHIADVAASTYSGTMVWLAAHLKPGRCANPAVAGFIGTVGTTYGDKIRAATAHAREYGGAGDDCLYAGPRASVLSGGAGNDLLQGGPSTDHLAGGPGNDVIRARDRARDTVDCGPGRDTAYVDRRDIVTGCERVARD